METLLNSIDKFFSRVVFTDNTDCWKWGGHIDSKGYGTVRNKRAHRVSYQLLVGDIPANLTLDHLCRVRDCVNPSHLEPVTAIENTMRGESPFAQNARKTHCPKGHPLGGGNLLIDTYGRRRCRQCRQEVIGRFNQKDTTAEYKARWYRDNRAAHPERYEGKGRPNLLTSQKLATILELLSSSKLSHREIGRQVGCAGTTVSRIYQGYRPPYLTD